MTVAEIAVNSEGRCSLRIADNCMWYAYRPGDRVKRPKPEVVGADGKPIKVGETVWHVVTGTEYVVDGIKTDGYRCVTLRRDSYAVCVTVDANLLTHEQPDSLERILDDLTMRPWDYCNSHGGTAPGQDESDCIVYMMRDLLARQRRVLERDRNE